MRILIADDEPMVRLGIRSMISEKYPGQHEVTEAGNGVDLVRRAEELPHLAFVDIRMPLMDGIQAIAIARKKSPDTQWVLLTGFSDFSYAQQAIRLGVTDYLLKPIGPEQLAEAVDKAAAHARDTHMLRNRTFESALQAYFYETGLFEEPQTLLPEPAKGEAYTLFLMYPDCANAALRTQRTRQTLRAVQRALGELEGVRLAAFALPSASICVITLGKASLRQQASDAMKEVCQQGETLTVLASPVSSANALYETYRHMNHISEIRAVYGYGAFMPLSWLEANAELPELRGLARQVDAIGLAYADRNALAFRQAVEALRGEKGFPSKRLPLGNIQAYLKSAAGLSLEAPTAEAWFDALMDTAFAMQRNASGTGDLVVQIKDYVAQHYTEDIGINTLADRMDITPNYLSRIFSQYAGCRFVSYLSQVRVEAAKKLLQQPGVTIREVAEAVGYQSARHFTKVFAKSTGQIPSRYTGERADDLTDS